MLRFRNRFTERPSPVVDCGCGLRVSFSQTNGRETVIHEVPWCPTFERLMQRLQGEAGVEMHVALVAPEEGKTMIVADGDSVDDVRDGGPAGAYPSADSSGR